MPALWPASLPQNPRVDEWTETPRPNVSVFQPDVGPPILRRRSSINMASCEATFFPVTNAQRATFLTFYRSTLKDGVLQFEWAHPVELTVVRWRFDPESPPRFQTQFATAPGRHTLYCTLIRMT